jgi:hypothetical protein
MTKSSSKKTCLACDRNEHQTPLLCMEYREHRVWICPQHLPILIHNPQQLAGRLPGAEDLEPG